MVVAIAVMTLQPGRKSASFSCFGRCQTSTLENHRCFPLLPPQLSHPPLQHGWGCLWWLTASFLINTRTHHLHPHSLPNASEVILEQKAHRSTALFFGCAVPTWE